MDFCYVVGGVRIIPGQNSIELPGKRAITLRPKSFTVLIYLCQNSGKVISKDELIRVVLGRICVSDDSLTRCICDIRRALGNDSAHHLRTFYRLGYMIQADRRLNEGTCNDVKPGLIVIPCDVSGAEPYAKMAEGLWESITMRLLKQNFLSLYLPDAVKHPSATCQLYGSMQVFNGEAKVSVKLVDVAKGRYIWANSFKHGTANIFQLQEFLIKDIVSDLLSKLCDSTYER